MENIFSSMRVRTASNASHAPHVVFREPMQWPHWDEKSYNCLLSPVHLCYASRIFIDTTVINSYCYWA